MVSAHPMPARAVVLPRRLIERIPVFQRRLVAWYRRHQRKLPWRETRDPYKILVSEVMLQQTQVDRVIPKYREFLTRYPTVRHLAKSNVAELKKVWYPLGYNIRPLRLRNIAKQVVQRHEGRLPGSYDGLIAMDGIGRYTAGAVLSFAFGQDAPILDTNVARLLERFFGTAGRRTRSGPAGKPTGRRERVLWELARQVIPPGDAYTINQGMMDFGATICTARAPKCPTCVLRHACQTYPFLDAGATARASRRRRH